MSDYLSLSESVVKLCRSRGASGAEVYIENGEEFSVNVRSGSIESLKQSVFKGLGLRLFQGNKAGFSYTTDFTIPAIELIIQTALHLAELSDSDEHNVLPDMVPSEYPDLDLFDPHLQNISTEEKIALAQSLEKKVFEKDPRILHTEGAGFSSSSSTIHFFNSKGASGSYSATLTGMSVSPVAVANGIRTSGSWYSYNRFFDELNSPDQVAAIAVERTVRLLGARKIRTTKGDVILDPSCGVTFLSSFFSLINGDNVNRGLSLLKNKMGEKIAPDFVTIVDDGTLKRKIGSRPFDGEGIGASRYIVVENGVLRSFLYDTKAALTAGALSTGNAHRSYDSEITIGANNFFMEKGNYSPKQIIGETTRGLYVTQLMGFGFDPVSGMFSYGAAGLWIENGTLTYPVHEVVIASDIKDMLMNIQAVGNDLEFRGSIACPTLKISDMTIGGN